MSFSVKAVKNVKDMAISDMLKAWLGVTERGCWQWMGPKAKGGYGFITVQLGLITRTYSCYRLCYEYYKGKPPFGLVIRHLCSNRSCINPDHLKLGSQKENMQDKVEAGRAHGCNKLPPQKQEPVVEYCQLPERQSYITTHYSRGFRAPVIPKLNEPRISPEARQVLENASARFRAKIRGTRQQNRKAKEQ